MPTFGSLFAGIGGIDLGLERAGWTGRWQVEWDPFCQHVLAHHWPDVPRYGDITAVDWSTVEPVDLIAGGFPCQPVSIAGKQAGQDDDRWLWPEFVRSIRALRPRFVLVENVRNLLAVNDGGPFGEVLGDLAALGYDAEWDCIPAAAVGAPHLRDRVWIVAHCRDTDGIHEGPQSGVLRRSPAEPGRDGATRAELGWPLADADDGGSLDPVRAGRDAVGAGGTPLADADRSGRQEQRRAVAMEPELRSAERGSASLSNADCGGLARPWIYPRSRRPKQAATDTLGHHSTLGDPDGVGREWSGSVGDPSGRGQPSDAGWWRVEPDVGRVAHGVPARVDRLRALGNAVVPQVVEVIGRRLMAAYLDGVA